MVAYVRLLQNRARRNDDGCLARLLKEIKPSRALELHRPNPLLLLRDTGNELPAPPAFTTEADTRNLFAAKVILVASMRSQIILRRILVCAGPPSLKYPPSGAFIPESWL